ncbi:MFS general substrate transporter, partial [Aspergillus ellipticus CBS 707.79]
LLSIRYLDILGIVLIIASVICLILAMQFGSSSSSWRSSRVIGPFIGAGLILVVFPVSQWRQGDRSTIPLRVVRQRSVLTGALFSFFLEISIYVTLYYIPFYFQSAQLVFPTISGVRVIPLGISQIAAAVITSAIVSLTGHHAKHQVPFMVLGQVVSIIGTVCLTRLEVGTSTALRATFLIMAGLGHGMGLQMPFYCHPSPSSHDDIPIGNAITVFFSQLGAAIAVAIGESIFKSSVSRKVNASHLPISAARVIAAGPTGLRSLTSDPTTLRQLQDAYVYGIRIVMYFALAAACAAVPFAVGMEWRNVKEVARGKKAEDDSGTDADTDTSVQKRGGGDV